MNEIWKDVAGYEGLYQISNLGRVKSLARYIKNRWGEHLKPEKIMKSTKNNWGYRIITFHDKNGIQKTPAVHTLVLNTFLGKAPKDQNGKRIEGSHLDGNKDNNSLVNLIWETSGENAKRRAFHGTQNCGEDQHLSKLNESIVRSIRSDYRRGNSPTLGRKYGVASATIMAVVKRKTWKHVG